MKFYIAYGSNLNVEQMKYRCKGAKAVGVGFIKDYRLLFKGSKSGSYLSIEEAEGYKVPIGVWEVNQHHERSLDRYEGYPTFYYKKNIKIDVTLFENQKKVTLEGFIYIMHEDRKVNIPNKTYVEACLKGYEEFGFDKEYLKEALDYSGRCVDER